MNPTPGPILIHPTAEGWRVATNESTSATYPDLEAVASEVADGMIVLALPARAVLMERMRLPSTDREELEGMVRLQIEKTLPYPPEEITGDFTIVSQGELESIVLAAAIHTPLLDELCAPLRAHERLPDHVTVRAVQAALACPPDRLALLIYKEEHHVVVAVVEHGKLAYEQSVAAADPQTLASELPQLLLTAEMEGVPSDFSIVCLGRACAALEPIVGPLLGAPVEIVDLEKANHNPPETPPDLVPRIWVHERRRQHRADRLRGQLLRVGIGALGLLLVAVGYIVWLQVRVNRLDRELLKMRPELETVQTRQARWKKLVPASDPSLYPVEILYQVTDSLPSEQVRITQFSQRLDGFTVEGEAPSASEAIQFTDKLRENPALQDFSIEAGPPTILPNDHAKFRVFAKR